MRDDTEPLSYDKRKELQKALRSFLIELDLPYFVTIIFKSDVTLNKSRKILNEFHKRLDQRLFRKKFHLEPKEKRTFFVAFPEHFDTNVHYHLMLRVQPEKRYVFELYASKILRKICPNAKIEIKRAKKQLDVIKTTSYCCKDLIYEKNVENFVISTEFLNFKSKRDDTPSLS